MEEEIYEAPRLPIESYRQKLYKALSWIYEHYKNQGFMNALSHYRGDQEREMAFFLKKKLLVFQIIDEPTLLRGLNLDGLAINQQTPEGSFIIALQKILFEMDESVLAIILRQKLDEVLLISGGSSPLEAQRLAIQAQKIQDRDKIEQALKRQLIIHKPSVKEALPRKEKLVPRKEIIPSPEKKVVIKPTPIKMQRRGSRRKQGRPSSNPGKEKLKALIIKRQAKISEIADDLKVSNATISRWINEDSELKQLAKDQKRIRKGRSKRKYKQHPDRENLIALIKKHKGNLSAVARDPSLRITNRTLYSWIEEEKDLESLVEEQKKKQSRAGGARERKYHHPGKEILKQLIEEHNARLFDMAKDPRVNASQPTLSIWINQDPELRRLAHEQREFRRKKKG